MKIAHISDLHLGKNLHNFSLIEDQKYILDKIIDTLVKEKIQALIIAGDVYDKSIASVEAINLFESFLLSLVQKKISVLIVSGNHDSFERLTFGKKFMESCDIYFSKSTDKLIDKIQLKDEFGNINFYLLPFIKPADVRHTFSVEEIHSYEDAVKYVIDESKINKQERNILVAHQNVLNAQHCDSEDISIGGVDAISSSLFSDFDYVALGHIHKPQFIGQDKKIRFCGTPLKYSVSELEHEKSITIIDFKQKNDITFEYIPLQPKRDIRRIKGTFEQIIENSKNDSYNKQDFIDIILTNENEVEDAIYKLRTVYPNVLQITYDNSKTNNVNTIENIQKISSLDPNKIFSEFYENRNGLPMDEEQSKYIKDLILNIWK